MTVCIINFCARNFDYYMKVGNQCGPRNPRILSIAWIMSSQRFKSKASLSTRKKPEPFELHLHDATLRKRFSKRVFAFSCRIFLQSSQQRRQEIESRVVVKENKNRQEDVERQKSAMNSFTSQLRDESRKKEPKKGNCWICLMILSEETKDFYERISSEIYMTYFNILHLSYNLVTLYFL